MIKGEIVPMRTMAYVYVTNFFEAPPDKFLLYIGQLFILRIYD